MSERAGIFDDNDFDVGGFTPKKDVKTSEAPAEAVRAVAERANFKSREPASLPKEKSPARKQRRYRTGRNVQLGIKVRREPLDAFYAIADKQNWVLGEAFERAVEALKRELAAKPG